MSGDKSAKPVPGAVRTALGLVWVLAVVAAYCAAYSISLVEHAQRAAGRLPFLGRLLELLHLGS